MGIIVTIIIGFFVGLIARFVKPGDDKMGFVMTTLVGIGGSFLGAYLGQAFGIYEVGEPIGFLGSVIGSVMLLVILKMLLGKK